MPLIPIAMALAQFAPMIAGWLGGSKAEDVAGKVVGIAQAVTGQSAPDAALAALQADPALSLQFQQAILAQQAQLALISADVTKAELAADTAITQAVNTTMQVEAKGDHWPSYSWRPFIGFTFGLYIMSLFMLPLFHVQPITLSADMTLTIGAILGVASFFRGKAQADPRVSIDNRG
jgi:hypothetical protein